MAKLNIPQTRTTVEFGGPTFRAVPTGIHQNAIFPGESGLLGNGLLAQFDPATFHGRSHRLFLLGGEQSASQAAP